MVASAFLPVHAVAPRFAAVVNTEWLRGPGWSFVGGGLLIGALALRAFANEARSWAGLWIGALVTLTAVTEALGGRACDRLLVCIKAPAGAGLYVAGISGVLAVVGWAIGLEPTRPQQPAKELPSPRPASARSAPSSQEITDPGWRYRPRTATASAVWCLLGYTGLSLALFGLPVLGHIGSTIIAANDGDPNAYIWFYAWWPHAILNGLNPFITNVIFAPAGFNLTWATSVPAPSLLMTPVTLAFGPVATFNVLALVAPTACAFSAFLLCRHLTRATAPAFVGGYIFGFSPYMIHTLQGAPNLYLVALAPLMVLFVIRRVQGSVTERTFLIFITLAVALQFLTSFEILFTVTFFGGTMLLVSLALLPEYRSSLIRTAQLLSAAYVAAGVVVSPILFYMAFRDHVAPNQANSGFALDLLSPVLPDSSLEVAPSHLVGGTPSYYGGLSYLGIPLVTIFLVCGWQYRRNRGVRLLGIALVIPAVASLGGRLMIRGMPTVVGLPWGLFASLPGLDRAIPQRFAVFTFLGAAMLVATWLSLRGSRARWGLALLAVAFILPNVGNRTLRYTLSSEPALLASGHYREHVRADDRVLVFPILDGQRWQAQAGFGFRLVGGGVGALPPSYARYPIFETLMFGSVLPPDYAHQLRRFMVDKGAATVLVDRRVAGSWTRKLFGSLGVNPVNIDGFVMYRLRSG